MRVIIESFGNRVIWRIWGLALPPLILIVMACGGAAENPGQTSDSPGGFGGLSGAITVDGSSTVFPISEAVAEEFGNLTGGKVRVTVGISGTGGGFKKFCNGETDVVNASRPIKFSEVELCDRNGIEYIELPVAIDGLTVMVHPENNFVECLTVGELRKIWAPEAEENVVRWTQVRPEWPDMGMRLYGPGVASGTFDYFTEVVNGEAQASRGDFIASEDDNVLIHGVSGDNGSLGYFGYAYFIENRGRLKALGIDGGQGCITPTDQTITAGTYSPLSRPLFVYVTQAATAESHIKEFLRFYLSDQGRQLVSEVGYMAYPTAVNELALSRLEKGLTGTLFGGDNPHQGSVEEILGANQ